MNKLMDKNKPFPTNKNTTPHTSHKVVRGQEVDLKYKNQRNSKLSIKNLAINDTPIYKLLKSFKLEKYALVSLTRNYLI